MGENEDTYNRRSGLSLGKTALLILGVFLIIFIIIFAVMMVVGVGVGQAVLLVDPVTSSISDPILGPTYKLKAPWATAVYVYYATDSYEATVPCFSSDQLEMEMQVLVRWSLDTNKIRDLFNKYPYMNYKETAIQSILEETMRLITKNYTALETIEFRQLVRDDIEQSIIQELETESSLAGSLIGLELDLKNIGYPEKYTAAIEDKLVSEQQQIQADFEKARILILANATAQELVITASGAAEAKIIEANATREAIELVLQSVGAEGNQTRIAELYLWVQALQKMAPDIEILIVGADGIPVLLPTNSTGS